MNTFLHNFPYLLLIFYVLVLAFACTDTLNSEIIVAAAANTRYVMEELNNKYFIPKGYSVKIIYGSSGKLSTQILNHAPFDLFLSADSQCTDKIYEESKGIEFPKTYARGQLIFITHYKIKFSKLKALLTNSKMLTIANPEQAPYGRAAMDTLEFLGLDLDTYEIIYGSNVSETAHFFLSGSESAFLPASYIYSETFKIQFNRNIDKNIEKYVFMVPQNYYAPLDQKMILLTEKARKIYDFIISPEASKIWDEMGYQTKGDTQ